MKMQNEDCGFCKQYWKLISKDEDELFKLKKHPKIYGSAIQSIQQSLKIRYGLVKKCRDKNHPDTMY